ncbi:MAG: hypothetical protein Q8O94_03600 [bacterium]|nr:hypothetical protein [bacterium]
MIEPKIDVTFDMSGSCNNLLQNLQACCCSKEPEYWVNSRGELEPWSQRRARVGAREVAHERFVTVVDRKITTLHLDKSLVMPSMPLDPETPRAITKSLVDEVSEALDAIYRQTHQAPPR